mgnify:CR=1 FL=1
MSKFLLILWIGYTNHTSGPISMTFNSVEACQRNGKEIVEILNIENNLPNVRAPGVGYRPDMTPRYYKCIEIKE